MKNEFQKHKKSDKVKWVLTCIAFVLVFAVIAGICMQLFAKDEKFKPSNWFAPVEELQPDSGENTAVGLPSSRSLAKTTAASLNENDGITTYADTVSEPSWWDDSSTKRLVADNYADGFYTFERYVHIGNETINDNYSCLDIRYIMGDGGYTAVCKANLFPHTDYTLESVKFYIHSADSAAPGQHSPYVWNTEEIECLPYTYMAGIYSATGYISEPFALPYRAVDGHSTANDDVQIYIRMDVSYTPKSYPLPEEPVKEGYTFTGWYMGTDGECDGECTAYTENVIYEDTELHAHFVINEYTVTFNSAGGNDVKNVTVNWNTVISPETPQRRGYTFTGWYYSDGTIYENQPITSDTTLTAHWEAIMCTVTFYVGGEVYETKQVAWGTYLTGVTDMAAVMNLQVMSLSPTDGGLMETVITGDTNVNAVMMDGADKVVNTVKNNKWAIIGGVAGGIALIAIIAAVCGGIKRNSK